MSVKKKPVPEINMDYADKAASVLERYTGVRAVRPYFGRAFRDDGKYENVITKYGTSRDSSEMYNYISDADVTDQEMAAFYEQDGLFSRIIDAPAEEAVKHGFEIKSIKDEATTDFVNECLDELDYEEIAMQSLKWARLFGGSIAVMMINDGHGVEEPVDWKNIKSIDDIRIFDRSVIQPDTSSMFEYDGLEGQDPFRTRGSRLGYPEIFHVSSNNTGSFDVHETRCLIFRNGILPENTSTSQYQFWGTPEYVRINRAIRDVEVAHGMAPKMLDRSVQAIYKMKNLQTLLMAADGEDAVLKRLQTIDLARGIMNSMILDADGEDYDFKSFSYTGVSDVINTTCNYLSALTNIPQTILFGRSPAGMNSTGAADLENYYNYVERIQKRMLRSNLRYLLSVILQAGKHTGEVKHVPRITIEFNSLWSMTEQERVSLDLQKAQVESAKAQTISTLIQAQVVDPDEARKEYADDEEIEVDTMLDEYTDKELEENSPKQQQQQQGGGDPMAAMMGGGGENPMASLMGGGGAAPTEQQQPPMQQQQKKAAPPKPVHEETPEDQRRKKKKLHEGGNSPDAAPEATKLPQDMLSKDVNRDSETSLSTEVEPVQKQEDPYLEEENEDAEIDAPTDFGNLELVNPGDEGTEIEETPTEPTDTAAEGWRAEEVGEASRPRGGVGVIILRGDKILTGTRIDGDAGGYGLICGPGGHIEDGETPKEAAIRETREEFGIVPLNLKCLSVIGDEDPDVQRSFIFVATEYSGDPTCDDSEMREVSWRDIEQLSCMEDRLFKPFKDSLKLLLMEMYREDSNGDSSFVTASDVVDNLPEE